MSFSYRDAHREQFELIKQERVYGLSQLELVFLKQNIHEYLLIGQYEFPDKGKLEVLEEILREIKSVYSTQSAKVRRVSKELNDSKKEHEFLDEIAELEEGLGACKVKLNEYKYMIAYCEEIRGKFFQPDKLKRNNRNTTSLPQQIAMLEASGILKFFKQYEMTQANISEWFGKLLNADKTNVKKNILALDPYPNSKIDSEKYSSNKYVEPEEVYLNSLKRGR